MAGPVACLLPGSRVKGPVPMQTDPDTPRGGERRGADRRKAQVSPLPFPDRRQGDRRSGKDRRAEPRV